MASLTDVGLVDVTMFDASSIGRSRSSS